MPDVYRYTIDRISQIIDKAIKNKVPMVALFPKQNKTKKNELGTEALNEDNFSL
jgi:porphobilinogen synthase